MAKKSLEIFLYNQMIHKIDSQNHINNKKNPHMLWFIETDSFETIRMDYDT